MDENRLLTFDEVMGLFDALPLSADIIAFDGLPLAGKSTLAMRLVEDYGFGFISLDDFVKPRDEWPSEITPAYPFPFVRNDELLAAIRALRDEGMCAYYPFDWEGGWVSPDARYVVRDKPIIIEGVGALGPELTQFYDLRFFIESDPVTLMPARLMRDGDVLTDDWLNLYLPSDELYLATNPQARADFLVAGRGL